MSCRLLRLVGVGVVRVQGGCRVVWREALGVGFVRGGLRVMGGGKTEARKLWPNRNADRLCLKECGLVVRGRDEDGVSVSKGAPSMHRRWSPRVLPVR